MGLPVNINDLLHGHSVEWERLEFKRGWNPEAILHTLCAFANDFHNLGGGYIFVGIADKNGRPVLPPEGIAADRLEGLQKELLDLGYRIQPHYHPLMIPYVIDGRHTLALWAPGGQNRPYKAPVSLSRGNREYAYFIRKGPNTVRAKGSDETELLSLAANVPFDDRLNRQGRVEDLSRQLMRDFLKEVQSDLVRQTARLPLVELGRQMNVIGGPPEAPFPLNVGLIFFHQEPYRFFPAMQIDVVWFPEGPGGDRFTEKVFRGPLARMLREALDYLKRNYLNETVIKHPDRAEATRVANFPYEAFEEALVNAVYHRSYEIREPVEVRITAEDLVVLNFPGPDPSIRLDQLKKGRAVPRRYRNRRIGEFLKELDLTEGRATGIPKILRAMRENGSPAPEFETDDDRTYFMIRLPVHPDASSAAIGEGTRQVTEQVTEQVDRLISSMPEDEVSAGRLMTLLKLAHRPTFLYSYLQPALEAGLLQMTIPEKPRSSRQKYRLTEKGKGLRRKGKR